jgi:hypothetical protein
MHMPPKRDTVLEMDQAGDAPPPQTDDIASSPKMLLALGRGKTGKSTFIRYAAEYSISRGNLPVIADADRTNATLAAFFDKVERPPSPADDDVVDWLEAFADRQITDRFSAYLDMGGGDLVLKNWAASLDLAPFLMQHGITPIAMHFVGSDIDDLTYLRDVEAVFQPQHTAIVLNEGTLSPGRVARKAFAPILQHEIFRTAVARGAQVVRMPALACMQEIETRGLCFEDAQNGRVKSGQAMIGPVARQKIAIWRREMAASFAPIDSWLP